MDPVEISRQEAGPGCALLTARVLGAVVGSVVLAAPGESSDWPLAPVLRDLAVEPLWRRRGIGTALVAAAESLAAEQGAELLVLEVDAGNGAAARLYAALGWLPVGEPSGYSYASLNEDGVATLVQVERQSWAKALMDDAG